MCWFYFKQSQKLMKIVPMEYTFLMDSLFHHFPEFSTPWIHFLWGDLQFSHQFCVVTSIHSEFVVALFMILQWVYYPSFSMNIVTNYIYVVSTRFKVDLLKKFSMSFPPEQSRPREISPSRYDFGWGASPNATISKEHTNHNCTTTTTIRPALIAIVVVLGNALLVVSYYNIFSKYCKASRWRHFFRRRHRSLDSEDNIQVNAYSLEGFQDSIIYISSSNADQFTWFNSILLISEEPYHQYIIMLMFAKV